MVFIWTGEGQAFETLKSYFVSRPVGSEFPEVLLAFGLLLYTWANLRRAKCLQTDGGTAFAGQPR